MIAQNAKNHHFASVSDIQGIWKICVYRGFLEVLTIKSIIIHPIEKYERDLVAGIDIATLFGTGRGLPLTDALLLLDQFIFNILIANTDAHVKNYSLFLPVGAGLRLAPLYDVLTALSCLHVIQYFVQSIAGKKHKLGDIIVCHWDAITEVMCYRPIDVCKQVKELVHGISASYVPVTDTVESFPGVIGGFVEESVTLIRKNSSRIAKQY